MLIAAAAAAAFAAPARIVLVAGAPSHYAGAHEHNAGMAVLQRCLNEQRGVQAAVVRNGWPEQESVFEGARAIVFFLDGGARHPLLAANRLETLASLVSKKVGLGMIHYSLEVPKERGGPELLRWIGGFYERPYSQNPINKVDLLQPSPSHPISRGWKPFRIEDEFYYRIRFDAGAKGRLTPTLQAMLPKDKPQLETLAWAFEREGGGRGFGFTGGHFHYNWGVKDYRLVVLNSILWIAGAGIPKGGAACEVTPEELKQHLDPGKPTLEQLLKDRKH